ncbi:MAG: tRNA pseudouridine(55) synthase TruB [Candidatus Komeilibacteria bacterium]|nr:tRNA pseudouridine(55) synthase TruB [Candidatus Komeilibacteria bacterium]
MAGKVLIFGTFDILHPGHISLIKKAKEYGEVHVVVALDETVAAIKGRVPLHSVHQRKRSLEQYGVIPHVGDMYDRLRVFREVNPQTVVLGHDQFVFVDQLNSYIQEHKITTQIIVHTAFHPELFTSSKIQHALSDPDAAFLLIDKLSGEPSLQTVTQLRKITGIKQIGFAGTLDPLASGLLVCGISQACSLLDWWHLFPKTYEAEVRLGEASDTYDRTGIMKKVSDRKPSKSEVAEALSTFKGHLEQMPPMFSAKKIEGKRLYTLARNGETVERKSQTVNIFEMTLVSYEYPLVKFRVTCSTGTYVRSIAHELGEKLGVGAVLSELRRTAIGPFSSEQAHSVADILPDSWRETGVPILYALNALISYLFPEM